MDFSFPAEAEAFRLELRSWLDEQVTDRFRGLGVQLDAGPAWLEPMREWNHLLADAGYAAIGWPVAYGGRDASLIDEVVLAEELDRAGAPGTLNPIGISNIAPAIMQFGTDEQKTTRLAPMRRGDDIWCQGFSEPDAGSDLASLATSAIRDGGVFVVNGQKVWNTLGHVANWCELLVRTDPTATKHRGISCLLVDMTLPGIEVRPLVTITGEREFSEIFFTDVRVPADALLGPLDEGWMVAMTTLAHERAGVVNLHLDARAKIAALIDAARSAERSDGTLAIDDPIVRRELASIYLRGENLKRLADRAVSAGMHGRVAGPESSLLKLEWSELDQAVADAAVTVLGHEAATGRWGREQIATRALTIAGGTTEVNKNVIAQRILGLPRR